MCGKEGQVWAEWPARMGRLIFIRKSSLMFWTIVKAFPLVARTQAVNVCGC